MHTSFLSIISTLDALFFCHYAHFVHECLFALYMLFICVLHKSQCHLVVLCTSLSCLFRAFLVEKLLSHDEHLSLSFAFSFSVPFSFI